MFWVSWNEYWGEWRVINGRTGLSMWEFGCDCKERAQAYADRLNQLAQ